MIDLALGDNGSKNNNSNSNNGTTPSKTTTTTAATVSSIATTATSTPLKPLETESSLAGSMPLSSSRPPPRRRSWLYFVVGSLLIGCFMLRTQITTISHHAAATQSATGSKSTSTKASSRRTNQKKKKKKKKKKSPSHRGGDLDESAAMWSLGSDRLPPALRKAFLPLHAADALECRDSVVNFVINATDGKDECAGLKKAFDKTCGDGASEAPAATQRRRRLQTFSSLFTLPSLQQLRLVWYKAQRWVLSVERMVWGTKPGMDQDFWFAEDAVLTSWSTAQSLVAQDLDQVVQAEILQQWQADALPPPEQRRRLVSKRKSSRKTKRLSSHAAHRKDRHLDDDDDDDNSDDGGDDDEEGEETELEPSVANFTNITEAFHNITAALNQTKTILNRTKPMVLDLPTNQKHASGTLVQEALVLQQVDQLIEKVSNQTVALMEKASNQTVAAQQDAAASSKAMEETAVAVSNLLNDPESVEARTCCASILDVYHENCHTNEEENISDSRLFFVLLVMGMCCIVKSLIRYFRILWLPEAAGCILVGVLAGYILMLIPHHDMSFDGDWFLRIMVPPIIFEAALSIDKRSFQRHAIPIMIYAIVGTLLATFLTAWIVYSGSHLFQAVCTPIPFVEALTFGALISSIDPIAVLSVLSNMGMTDMDTIYVVIFGESLLNDGVAIVLFETLVHFLDEHLIIDSDAIMEASIHFTVVAVGSVMVGLFAGLGATVFFWLFYGCQTPLVEVIMFLCWALLPYYVCDGIGWSGIVSAVATGFVMDIHIVGPKKEEVVGISDAHHSGGINPTSKDRQRRVFFHPDGQMSSLARAHIGFVMALIATTLETAIFAYLGLFLFSHRYHWNFFHAVIAIFACGLSRAVVIPTLSSVANWLTVISNSTRFSTWKSGSTVTNATTTSASSGSGSNTASKATPNLFASSPVPVGPGVVIDRNMQIVLWFAGLRGAMSFALVESVPLYDATTGEGSPFKPELKAMTSATILFTVFVLGGYTYYIMDHLGMSPLSRSPRGTTTSTADLELEPLVLKSTDRSEDSGDFSSSSAGAMTGNLQRRSRTAAALF